MFRSIVFLLIMAGIVVIPACIHNKPYSSMSPIEKAFADGRRNRLKYRGGSAARRRVYQERQKRQDFNRVLKEQKQMIEDSRTKQ